MQTLTVFGTRPEAIKMAPLIKALNENPNFHNLVCVTGQHKSMLSQVLDLFNITPDFQLNVMTKNQTLSSLTSKILHGMAAIFTQYKPDLVFVHGDTTTTLAASLAAFYHRVKVAHVEAGLRTRHLYSPWPEEINRKLTDHLASLHFAPTIETQQNLFQEGIDEKTVFVTGNTVIDALYQIVAKLDSSPALTQEMQNLFPMLAENRKYILVTGHRRESFGLGFENICNAIAEVAKIYPEVDIIYPVHLNPQVQAPVYKILSKINNVHLIEPVDYLPFVYLMKNAHIILTDSGGIQEEAPSLGKPVLVMREITERKEALAKGTLLLVGTDKHKIVNGVKRLLEDEAYYKHMSWAHDTYGDGEAAKKIVNIVARINKQCVFSLQGHRAL
ncbi:MAG: UDP-N-acetylglucosamine 2-epimerase [Legionellales bacterium RIFCSPHIGHO2_12_FULL_37_14]|nr:MAG: UDP-N-acetylglucosamine 2-epimerase [Legionellales bacterium RIFCSPHIGHO2_12_FULL_37_14]